MQSKAWKNYEKLLKSNQLTLYTAPRFEKCADDNDENGLVSTASPVVACGCKRPRFASKTFEYTNYKEQIDTKYFLAIDVTSGTGRLPDRVFSPIIQAEGGAECVENIWQRSKVYHAEDISEVEEKEFWTKFVAPPTGKKNPRRSKVVAKFRAKNGRYPREVRYSFENFKTTVKREARRHIYAKVYNREIIQKVGAARIKQIQEMLAKSPGKITCVVLDYDGPKLVNTSTGHQKSSVLKMTRDSFWNASSGATSFGHGYIVAASIAGIDSSFDESRVIDLTD
jgi:hypothetical protein